MLGILGALYLPVATTTASKSYDIIQLQVPTTKYMTTQTCVVHVALDLLDEVFTSSFTVRVQPVRLPSLA